MPYGRLPLICLDSLDLPANDINTITQEFNAAGYALPAYECLGLSTKEIMKEQPVSVYPNPTSDFLYVPLKGSKEEKAEIYNMEGRKVMDAVVGNGKSQINVSNLQPGDYIVTIKSLEISTKFIKK